MATTFLDLLQVLGGANRTNLLVATLSERSTDPFLPIEQQE